MVTDTLVSAARAWLARLSPSARLRYRLAGKYLRGNGIEVGALHNPLPLPSAARVQYVDRVCKSVLREHYPEIPEHQIVEVDIVDNGEALGSIPNSSLDFIIANHFIEHCEDPISTVIHFFSKLRPDGVVYMAVPDKRFTFDRQRECTTLDHLRNDFLDGGLNSRKTHYWEFARYCLLGNDAREGDVSEVAARMMATSYSVHFHVWTRVGFLEFLQFLKKQYLPELAILEAEQNRKEMIFVLQKQKQHYSEIARLHHNRTAEIAQWRGVP